MISRRLLDNLHQTAVITCIVATIGGVAILYKQGFRFQRSAEELRAAGIKFPDPAAAAAAQPSSILLSTDSTVAFAEHSVPHTIDTFEFNPAHAEQRR